MKQMTNRRKQYIKKLIIQKSIGVAFLLMSIVIYIVASKGHTPVEQDATASIVTGLIGLYLVFTGHIMIG